MRTHCDLQRDDCAATPERARARVDAGRCAGRRGFPGSSSRLRCRPSRARDDNYRVIISRSSSRSAALGRCALARRRDSRNAIGEDGRRRCALFCRSAHSCAHTHACRTWWSLGRVPKARDANRPNKFLSLMSRAFKELD